MIISGEYLVLKTFAVFLGFLLPGVYCLAVFNNDNDFNKYGFTEHKLVQV